MQTVQPRTAALAAIAFVESWQAGNIISLENDRMPGIERWIWWGFVRAWFSIGPRGLA